MSDGRYYNIAQGDCISSIAEREGFLWKTLWNHSNNSKLRKLRNDPNVLEPGDVLWIPKIKIKEVTRENETTHNFVKLGNSAVFRLRLLNSDQPRADQEYHLIIDGNRMVGFTDSDGNLEQRIPAGAQQGKLELLENGQINETYSLQLGHLNPVDSILGVQQRLRNLGYLCDLSGEWDEKTKNIAAEFRQKHRSPESDEMDARLTSLLEEKHGS